MEHLKVAYYLVVLLVGVGAIVYTALIAGAYRLPFLKPLAWFLGFNNVLALINLTSAYGCANLIGFCALGQYSVLGGILGPAARLSAMGIVYALAGVAAGLRGRRLSRAFERRFGAGFGLLTASYIVTAALPRGGAAWIWLNRAQVVVFVLGVAAILAITAVLAVGARVIENAAERRAVRSFGLAYFAIYALFAATFWLETEMQFPPNALALLAINVVPLIWLRKPFAEAYASTADAAEDRGSLESFCRTRGLTAREGDILELILRGKSNAEIEKALFISIHTVKNHITNIHQKLGVRSRWQLISLFNAGRRAGRARSGQPEPEAETMPANGLRPQ